jgi:uncharacterized protein YcbX
LPVDFGRNEALDLYPLHSMVVEALESVALGWHGVGGDRRLALRRLTDGGGFPWLTAGKLHDLVLYAPLRRGDTSGDAVPTHVRTPEGEELEVFGDALAQDIGRRHGAPVQMMRLDHGIFDEATVSVLTTETVREIGRLAGRKTDARRFRPNVLVRPVRNVPFGENEWVGGVLAFGDAGDSPAVTVTMRDPRCSMVNIDPDDAKTAPEVLRAVVRANESDAGVYGTVTRVGRLAVGQRVLLEL